MIASFRVGGDCSGSSFFLVNVERRGARNLSIIEGALLLLLSSRLDVASAVESTTSDVHELVPVKDIAKHSEDKMWVQGSWVSSIPRDKNGGCACAMRKPCPFFPHNASSCTRPIIPNFMPA